MYDVNEITECKAFIFEVILLNIQDKFFACLIGGAIGDALGYPVEFMSLKQINSKYGESGITDLVINNRSGKAVVSDDTQMTLFTVDGLIWAYLSDIL
jgi:ADP-ribosylglycohydrolase